MKLEILANLIDKKIQFYIITVKPTLYLYLKKEKIKKLSNFKNMIHHFIDLFKCFQ